MTRRQLAPVACAVVLLHVAGVGLLLLGGAVGAGTAWLAYLLGMRHALDIDHIAAIDNVSRRLTAPGRPAPVGVGLHFALGHSSVVVVLLGVFAAAEVSMDDLPGAVAPLDGGVGAVTSGAFLWLIGLVNLALLLELVTGRRGGADPPSARAGALLVRVFRRPLGLVRRPRHMYLVGLLFALGLDTVIGVGLLAFGSAVAPSGPSLSDAVGLALVFAAGMCTLDATDGVLMTRAYAWGSQRRRHAMACNALLTSASVALALVIGTGQLLGLELGPRDVVLLVVGGCSAIGGTVALAAARTRPGAPARLRTP